MERNLDVAAAAFNGEELARLCLSIERTSPADFLPPDSNQERARQIRGLEARDDVSESVDPKHKRCRRKRQPMKVSNGGPDTLERRPMGQSRSNRSENVTPVEGPADRLQKQPVIRNVTDFGGLLQDQRQHSIVRCNEPMAAGSRSQGTPRGADPGIDHDDVNRSLGKIAVRGLEQNPGLEHIIGWNTVRNIDHINLGSNTENHALHDADERIPMAEVRDERNDHGRIFREQRRRLMKRVYLDNNATTATSPEVVQAMTPYLVDHYGNASSIHWFGQHAKAAIDEARQQVARLIHAEGTEIVFVGSGTEADNLAIRGIAESQKSKGRHVITSRIEHHAVMNTCRDLEKHGFEVTWVPVSGEGLVDPDDVRRAIRPDTILITTMHANNEIGTVQPIQEIGRIAEESDIYFHSDGVQSTGKIPVDVRALKVDLYSISAHKFHGPMGVGALFVRRGTPIKPVLTGGGHERNRRSGTENVPGIVGFGAAARLANDSLVTDMAGVGLLRDRLEAGITSAVGFIHINGVSAPRLPTTSNIMVDFAEGEGLVIALDLKGVAVSTGSACSSGSLEPSHVLTAIGKTPDEAHGSLRFSLSRFNMIDDVDYVLEVLPGIVDRLRELSPYYRK